jgi:hypothetical protein
MDESKAVDTGDNWLTIPIPIEDSGIPKPLMLDSNGIGRKITKLSESS